MVDSGRSPPARVCLADLVRRKAEGRRFSMLTAYDFPTAAAAQAAGVDSLLVGDSLGCVVLGHPNTRAVPLDLMIVLADAVRRAAPRVYLVGDLPYEAVQPGVESTLRAARRFRDESGCDAVKLEVAPGAEATVRRLARAGLETIAHLGLRPQSIESPADYRAHARDEPGVRALVDQARRAVDAGAAMLLLEAVPPEAAAAVVAAVPVPVIGCGAGPACDGHVVVTHDLLGFGAARPPRFVPVLAQVSRIIEDAIRRYAAAVADGSYPASEHFYAMRKTPAPSQPAT